MSLALKFNEFDCEWWMVEELTQNQGIMGVEEMILQYAREKGIEKGIEMAIRKLLQAGLSVSFISENMGVPVELVQRIKNELEGPNHNKS